VAELEDYGVGIGSGRASGPGSDKAPFQSFSEAREGDWVAFAFRKGKDEKWTEVSEVASREDPSVTIATWIIDPRGRIEKDGLRSHSIESRQTVSGFFSGRRGLENLSIESVKRRREVVELGGKRFECLKVAARTEGPELTLWFSPDVKVFGV